LRKAGPGKGTIRDAAEESEDSVSGEDRRGGGGGGEREMEDGWTEERTENGWRSERESRGRRAGRKGLYRYGLGWAGAMGAEWAVAAWQREKRKGPMGIVAPVSFCELRGP